MRCRLSWFNALGGVESRALYIRQTGVMLEHLLLLRRCDEVVLCLADSIALVQENTDPVIVLQGGIPVGTLPICDRLLGECDRDCLRCSVQIGRLFAKRWHGAIFCVLAVGVLPFL